MSHSPLIIFPEQTAVFSPAYYGSVDYYATLARYGRAVINHGARFDKRLKSTHRTTIADVNGVMNLTVPIEKPVSLTAAKWRDIRISRHGSWWNVHRVALESAYGRTPFFEFYIDRFKPFLDNHVVDRYPLLADLNMAANAVICDILGITTEITASIPENPNVVDFQAKRLPTFQPISYYQIRQADFGFIPHLSILDLIFNIGPEAPLLLKRYPG